MLITRRSEFSGNINTMDLPVTEDQMNRFSLGNELIQDIFQNLTPSEREFIKTGITDDEWNRMFGIE